jgi:hypothetical protein
MSERWTLNAVAEPSFRHWDGETVAHHLLSNDTHRMAEPAGWILQQLGSGPLATADIAADSHYDSADLEPALRALADLGLIQPC